MKVKHIDLLNRKEERWLNSYVKIDLFPSVTKEDVEQTLFWLKKYAMIKQRVQDYEEHADDLIQTDVEGETARKASEDEYYSNKTANAVILAEKQRMVYEQYKVLMCAIERANGCIVDDDSKNAVFYRYIEGHDYKNAVKFFACDRTTFDRKLWKGTVEIAELLKLWGVFGEEWNY